MITNKKHNTSFKSKPQRFKTDILYGQTELKIDQSSGVIRDVSVCTAGEAKGHGVMLEQSFIEDVVRLGNEYKLGLKCRFGHPNMSSESLGTYLGRFKNFRVSGSKAIADLYLDDVSKTAPGGDLYGWVLSMAAKNPDQFGSSIVFNEDYVYHYNVKGEKVIGYNYDDETPNYVAIAELCATDIVDDPAANDDGLFSSAAFNSTKFAVRITEFLDENPDIWKFVDEHPDKFKPFLDKYNQYQKKKSHIKMSKNTKPRNTFFHKLAAAFTTEKFDTADYVTTDGSNIRIVAAGDQPAVGDEVYVIADDGSQSVAPDGDYTISGGDLDGYVISVSDGLISQIVVPDTAPASEQSAPAAPVQQKANDKEVAKLKAENDKLKKELKAQKDEFEKFKKQPLAEHTAVGADEDPNGDLPAAEKDSKYWNQPWNKKHKK